MLLLPNKLRDELMAYVQTNPSPNVPVGKCMQLLAELQNLKSFGKKPAVVPKPEDNEGPAQPGGEEPAQEDEEKEEVVNG